MMAHIPRATCVTREHGLPGPLPATCPCWPMCARSRCMPRVVFARTGAGALRRPTWAWPVAGRSLAAAAAGAHEPGDGAIVIARHVPCTRGVMHARELPITRGGVEALPHSGPVSKQHSFLRPRPHLRICMDTHGRGVGCGKQTRPPRAWVAADECELVRRAQAAAPGPSWRSLLVPGAARG